MEVTIKYTALVIFLIVVFLVVITLRGGFPIRNGGGSGPIVEGAAGAPISIFRLT